MECGGWSPLWLPAERALAFLLLLLLVARPLAVGGEHVDWPMYGLGPARSSATPVTFSSATLGKVWSTLKPRTLFTYVEGIPYWSSPSVGTVNGTPMVFLGCYDNEVYAFDAATGKQLWTFATGDAVSATPTFAVVDGRPMVFVASADRSIYALDPVPTLAAGADRRLWHVQTLEWQQTVNQARMANPLIATVDGQQVLFCGVWNNDQSGTRNVQRGEIIALKPADGTILWRRVLGTGAVNTPCLGTVKGEPALFVPYEPGAVFAISARDGRDLWAKAYAGAEEFHGGISVGEVGGKPRLFIGCRSAWAYALDAETGEQAWEINVGTWVDSTPSFIVIDGRPVVFFGAYTYFVFACDAATGKELWRYRTRGIVQGSPVVTTMGGELVVCVNSLDDHVYVLRAGLDEGIAAVPFAAADLRDPEAFAARLVAVNDPLAGYLRQKLPDSVKEELNRRDPKQPFPDTLRRAFVILLNQVRDDPALYAPERFQGVSLPETALSLLRAAPGARDHRRLNRLLLEAAFPDALEPSRFLFRHHLGKFPWTHYLKGKTIWSSCIVAQVDGRPLLIAPSYSGVVHAFAVGDGTDANVGAPQDSFWDALGVTYTIPVLVIVVIVLVYTFRRLIRSGPTAGGRHSSLG